MQQVSWFDAVAYCNTLSLQEGYAPYYQVSGESGTPGTGNYSFTSYVVNPTDKSGYRLPTEAEWEYAARGGSTEAMYVANGLRDTIAWSASNSGNRTRPVGKLTSNSFGFYDMLGNVWGWAEDWFGAYPAYQVAVNPQGPAIGMGRVNRGGCFSSSPDDVRAAFRVCVSPYYSSYDLGFRPARSLQN